jgi:DNA polymerase-3 subunit epsilon
VDYAVVDVETTGFDPKQGDRILEISAIRTDGQGNVLASFTSLINPGVVDTGAEHIHGISVEMLTDAPAFADILGHLADILNDAVFVAHHAKFDESFIANEAQLAGLPLRVMPGLCTYWLSKQSSLELSSHKLANLVTHFQLEAGVAHCAYDDALAVVQLLPKLLTAVPGIEHYVPLQRQGVITGRAAAKLRH